MMIKSIQNHLGKFNYEELKRLLDLKFLEKGEGSGEYIGLLKKIKEHFISNNL